MINIIAFCGVKQSGKTTAANIVLDNYPVYKEIALADKIKNACSKVFKIKRNYFDDQNLKEKEFDIPIFLTENHISEILQLYYLPVEYKDYSKHIGIILTTPRKIAQYIGTELLKSIDENIHCKVAVCNLTPGDYLITDLRFPDEFHFFKNMFECKFNPFYISRLAAEINARKDRHASEQKVFETAKLCMPIDNNKDLITFRAVLLEEIKKVSNE